MLNGSVKLPASTNQARNAAGHSTDWPSMTWKRLFTSSTTGTAGKIQDKCHNLDSKFLTIFPMPNPNDAEAWNKLPASWNSGYRPHVGRLRSSSLRTTRWPARTDPLRNSCGGHQGIPSYHPSHGWPRLGIETHGDLGTPHDLRTPPYCLRSDGCCFSMFFITKLTNFQTRSLKSAKEDIQKRCIQFFEQQKNLAPLSLGCD